MSRAVTDRDLGYRALMRRLGELRDISVSVGVRGGQLEGGAVLVDGDDEEDIVEIAAVHEFGSRDGRIPERSFLRSTADENVRKYERLLEKATERVVSGGAPELAFGMVGAIATGDVQRKIAAGVPPPLAPVTVKRKGSSTPLIDTGRLRQSIDFVVEVG
jgi:phage gpG-like protein